MTQNFLKPDPLTKGIITNILVGSWKNQSVVSKEILRSIHQALIDNQTFGEVAERIFVPIDGKKEDLGKKLMDGIQLHLDREKGDPQNKIDQVTLFPDRGFILKDDIHGAAFGRFKYVYRSKGTRIYWFESGAIEYRPVYSTIDEYGFNYVAEEFDGCNIFEDIEFEEIEHTPLKAAFGNGEILIENLSNINQDFIRDYAIEYLLYPPDVQYLSSFSIQLREQIWDSIIDLIKDLAVDTTEREEKLSLLDYLTNLMEKINIHPEAYHIIMLFDFYRENYPKIDENYFLTLMSILRKHSVPESPATTFPFDAEELISELEALCPGTRDAESYHDLIFRCLSIIFANGLKRGKKEVRINEDRKRVDIVFDNHDASGFFAHIRDRHGVFCPKIFIECKNYTSDPKNPEVDQLLGRFGTNTGKFGILICREVKDTETLMKRCKDAMHNDKKYVMFFDDADIKTLLRIKGYSNEDEIMNYLFNKWDKLILNA